MTDKSEEIKAVNRRFEELYAAGDEGTFSQLYTEDALIMLPGSEALQGRAGARQFLAGAKQRGVRKVVLTTHELEVSDNTAWERGSAVVSRADGSVAAKNKYIVIWKRTTDGWKLHRDILNSDLPQ